MAELNDKEKKVLKMMFRMLNEVVEACGGYVEIDYDCFDGNDLYNLFEKLGIGDYWDKE